MKIIIVPGLLKANVAKKIAPSPRKKAPDLVTNLDPKQPLATIPDLRVLYGAQTTQVEKWIMLMERLTTGGILPDQNKTDCPQGLAVSECRDDLGKPIEPNNTINSETGWLYPTNCLNKDRMPRNMFAEGVPLTCKEGE
jgi:hypothetical protein